MVIKTFAQPDEISVINRNGYQLLAKEIIRIGFFGRTFAARPTASKFQSSDKMKFLKTPKQMVTIKVIYLDVGFEYMRSLNWVIAKEIVTMNSCFGNPNILGLLDVFVGAKRVFLVFEYAEKENLTVQLTKPRAVHMKEKEALSYIRGACLGLKTLHSLGIAHGDLNPDNIFITKASQAKLGEFSFVKITKQTCLFLDDEVCGKNHQKGLTFFSGAINYAAPEVLDESVLDYDHQAADIWSLGATLYLLLNGSLPFQGQTKEEILRWQNKYFSNEARMVFVKNTTAACRELVWNMLSQDPKKRPTVWDLLESKCLKKYKTKEESAQFGNLATKKLIKIFGDEKYSKQQKFVAEYIQSRQKLLEEAHSMRKNDEDYHKFVAIPFHEGDKKEEIWRMTISRNTVLYGMTSISNCDQSKLKVFRNLSGLKAWKKMNNSNKLSKSGQIPEPSVRRSGSSDELKCFFCKEDSQCVTSSVDENSPRNEISLGKRLCFSNWLSIDYDKVIRNNKESMRLYECNPASSVVISKKPPTASLSLKQTGRSKVEEKREVTSSKMDEIKSQKMKKESSILEKPPKVKRVQHSKVSIKKEQESQVATSKVSEKKLKVKTFVESKSKKGIKPKTSNESTRKIRINGKNSLIKNVKDGKFTHTNKTKKNEDKHSVTNSKERSQLKIKTKKVEELTSSYNCDVDLLLSPQEKPVFSGSSLTPHNNKFNDEEDLPVLLLADDEPDTKFLADFKEKLDPCVQQSQKNMFFNKHRRSASACCERNSLSNIVEDLRKKRGLGKLDKEEGDYKETYPIRSKSIAKEIL